MHCNGTGKHLFAYILVMSVDKKKKDTGFLRFRLPVLLQQNLRCKVWDDTAKIRYIALFAISEQCSQKNLTLKLTVLIQKKRKKYVSIQCSASCELIRSTSTTSIEHAQRTLKRPKHATLSLCSSFLSNVCLSCNKMACKKNKNKHESTRQWHF